MKILFTGGGTGGHIFPLVAICREIRKIYSVKGRGPNGTLRPQEDLQLLYIGPKDPFGEFLLSQEGVTVKSIFAGKLRRYISPLAILQNFIDIFLKFPIGFLQAVFYVFFLAPDLVFSKGGYGALPLVLSAWLLQTPIFLHESDITPGLSNKIASKFSLIIFTSFSETEYFPLERMVLVGNPIRRELLSGSSEEARGTFQLTGEKPVILIFGGSQGAQKINDLVLAILPELLRNFEIIHQAGEQNFKQVLAEAKVVLLPEQLKYYHISPFLEERELSHAYSVSHLIISRAGSGSIFEIAAAGKPSVLIPLSLAAQNHQLKNAYLYSRFKTCVVMEETNITPRFFLGKLKYLLSHQRELEDMGNQAKEFSKPEAGRMIARHIIDYLFR